MTHATGRIYVGIGGWTYEPWRGVFYPKGLPHARELSYAGEHLTSIEINGTFYRTQTPATFRKWASEVPDGFVFSVKGPRYAVNRRVLSEAGDSIRRFLESGVTELGTRLGPLLWQFTPYKKFDEKDFGGFLELLPETFDGHRLRHVVEVRNDSFKTPVFITLARKGYYNGLQVHRVVPNFVVQDGDPRGDGEGGPGYTIRDELNQRPFVRGTVGMALSWKDTGGSQFFITHSPQPHLDALYTAFGHVVNGMDVVDRIQQGDTIQRVRVWDGKTMQ